MISLDVFKMSFILWTSWGNTQVFANVIVDYDIIQVGKLLAQRYEMDKLTMI